MEVKKHFKNAIIQHYNGTIGCIISAALLKSPSLSLPLLCSCVALMRKFWLWYYGITTSTVCFFVYFHHLFFFFFCPPGFCKNAWVTFVSIHQNAAGTIFIIVSPNQKGKKGHLCQCSLSQSHAKMVVKFLCVVGVFCYV